MCVLVSGRHLNEVNLSYAFPLMMKESKGNEDTVVVPSRKSEEKGKNT